MYWMRTGLARAVVLLVLMCLLMPGAWAAQDDEIPLDEIKGIVEIHFVEPVEPSVLEAATVEELFELLGDNHSGYMNPKQLEEFKISSAQEYAGVGMQLVQKEEYVQVVTVFPNTPAEKVGVQPGDLVKAVNGEDMKGKSLEAVASLIRGPVGSAVLIEFFRESTGEVYIVSLTRELIHLEALDYEMVEESIGYIRLDSFTPTIGKEFDRAVKELREQGMRGLILDLRQNPGGYLTAALDIGSTFAGIGDPLLHTEGRSSTPVSYQSRTPGFDLPLAVLVDEGSASASEIVAGIVRDMEAGIIIGTTTFGKASVQTVFPLSNGGAVKLTTAYYLTPNRVNLNGVGLVPDEIIEDPEEQLEAAKAYLRAEIAKLPLKPDKVLVLGRGQALLNEQEIAILPAPYLSQGQFLVPLRPMGEIFDLQIVWDGTNNQAIASIEGKQELKLAPGSRQVWINGQVQTLEAPPKLENGRLMVPVRLLADYVGAQCVYDGATGTVIISW